MAAIRRTDIYGGSTIIQAIKPEYYDPDLPCYHSDKLLSMLPVLNECDDCYIGITAWLKGGNIIDGSKAIRYLPQAEKEPDKAYAGRLLRSRWVNFFRSAINGFVGLLTDFEIRPDTPQSVLGSIEDIDMQGASLRAFLSRADGIALRDGFCGVLVEYPRRGLIDSAADELSNPVRPYLCLIERRDIVNWSVVSNRLELFVIRRMATEPDGTYGSKPVEQFWVMRPGYYQVFEIRNIDGRNIAILVDEVELRSPDGSLFAEIPIVFYPTNTINPFAELPPLHDLALDNVTHYQEWSDYREVRYKCNLPVTVRKGMLSDPPLPLTIGANTVVDVPIDGDFFFREPTGVAIAATRQAIIDLEAQMLRRSLSFFGGEGKGMTATEAELRSSATKSGIMQMAADKESAVQSILRYWTRWTGEDKVGGIAVNRSILKAPLSPQAVQVFSDLVVGGLLDRETFWEILNEGGILPESMTVQELVERTTSTVSLPLEA